MDALAARTAGLASGPALASSLKAVADATARDAIATAVVAVLDESAGRGERESLAPRFFFRFVFSRARHHALDTSAQTQHNNPPVGKENGGAPTPPSSAQPSLTDLASASCVLPGLALTHPRGAFVAAFFGGDKLVLRTAGKDGRPSTDPASGARELVVPATAIDAIAVLEDVPEDAGAVLVLLHVGNGGVAWGKATLDTLAVRFGPGASADVAWTDASDGSQAQLTGHAAVVLCQALGRLGVPPGAFDAPAPATFRAAASAAGGGCALGAAVGPRQGYLFPLARGLVFVGKPPALVPLAGVRAAVLGRARGGGSASFDLLLVLKEGKGDGKAGGKKPKPLEFSALPRAELGVVQAWLGERGVRTLVAGDDGAAAAAAAAESSEEESEEEESEEESGSEEEEGGKRKRKAGLAAAGAPGADEDDDDDDSEDDSDFEPGSPSSDGDRSVPTSDEEDGSDSGSSDSDGGSGSASLGSESESEEGSEGGAAHPAKRARGGSE
jgi:hypothetical protein